MPLVSAGDLVTAAAAAGRAIAAFNVITLEHAEAMVEAAEDAAAPVIVAVSENALRHRGGRLKPLAAACAALAEAARVPVGLHLDHIRSVDLLHAAAGTGFTSVMFDASALPYRENLAATRSATDWAHARGLWLEAELGRVEGKPGDPVADAHAPGVRTDPVQAAGYVRATGVDALAVAVGSRHAMTERTAALDLALVRTLADAVPVPLVLHGSSGVPADDIRRAVAAGMTKINIGTALNIAFTAAVRGRLAADPAAVDPRPFLADARAAMRRCVRTCLDVVAGPSPDDRTVDRSSSDDVSWTSGPSSTWDNK